MNSAYVNSKMNLSQILHSGDLELIVTALSPDEILHHFGEESFEYLAYEHMLAEQMERQRIKIPRRTEYPAATKGMLESWIREFCERNNKPLPRGFSKRNKKQLMGMYQGMLTHYQIKPSYIIPNIDLI